MATRQELHDLLVSILGDAERVYFQPPPSVNMQYPCIRYHREDIDTEFADNKPYSHKKRYLITVIDPHPDSEIPDEVAKIPTCVYDRFYAADNLNHDVFKLFF